MEDKIRIQNLVFPEGLSIRVENREYLTKKINSVFALIPTITGNKKCIRKEKTHQNVDGFSSVTTEM